MPWAGADCFLFTKVTAQRSFAAKKKQTAQTTKSNSPINYEGERARESNPAINYESERERDGERSMAANK